MLPPYLRVIQGDGINIDTLEGVLSFMLKNKWSADNLAFGSGGALLQRVDRDTQKCAYKCSYAVINGKEVNTQTPSTKIYIEWNIIQVTIPCNR